MIVVEDSSDPEWWKGYLRNDDAKDPVAKFFPAGKAVAWWLCRKRGVGWGGVGGRWRDWHGGRKGHRKCLACLSLDVFLYPPPLSCAADFVEKYEIA